MPSSRLVCGAGLSLLAALAPALAPAAERAIDKQVVVAADVDAVWAARTALEGITSFFAPDAEVEARVGGASHGVIDPLTAPGARGANDVRCMALQPERMPSFDWNAPPFLPKARSQRSFVNVRLEPVDANHTRVRLHHTGWSDGGQWAAALTCFDRAWGSVLSNLKTRLESGPQHGTGCLAQLRAMHAAAAAKAQP